MSNAPLLFEAINRGELDEVQRQIGANAHLVNEPGDDNITPLIAAARSGKRDIAVWLIAQGANTEAVDIRHGATPLGWAAYFARTDTVEALLDGGADYRTENAYGLTPFQVAEEGRAGKWEKYTRIKPEAYQPVLEVLNRHGAAHTRKPPE